MRPAMPERVRAALLAPASGKRAHLPPIMFAVYDALLAHVRTSRSGLVDGVDIELGQTNVSEETLAREVGIPNSRQVVRTALDEMVKRGVITRANPTKTQALITLVDLEEILRPPADIQPSWTIELAAKMWTAVAALRTHFAADISSLDVVPMHPWERALAAREHGALELVARIAEEDDQAQAQLVCEHVLGHLSQQAELEFTCKWLSEISFTRKAWSFARSSVGAKRLALDIQPTSNQHPTPNEILEREHTQDLDRVSVIDQDLSRPPDPEHGERADLVREPSIVTAVTAAEQAARAVDERAGGKHSSAGPQTSSRRGPQKALPATAEEWRRMLELPASVRTPRRPDESHAEWCQRETRERQELYAALGSAHGARW